ncbi:flagellar basal-body MS-ring/collar protein FliF [Neisseriaceae bacterium TC5R-5]|nr:flagellar basal-body MS-ring/collar protein FliF [Neisseriaceae bacterium TC5R-5]
MTFPPPLWQRSSLAGRIGLVLGSLLILGLAISLLVWLNRADYQPLFRDLDNQDAAAVVAALDKQKTPYQLADEGRSVLVEQATLHKTRMQLLAGGLDFKNAVGLELFNNTEFGMTEFAQKINYQRALQGELARTIMGFDEVANARVHLVLPEGGMLRKRGAKAKASVWVTLKGGKSLRTEQVLGIQRLVAAATPEMEAAAVTVLDQQGVALSPRERSDEQLAQADAQLQLKKDTEQYLTRKVNELLDSAVGAGQALAVVDVALDSTAVKLTRESVLGGPDAAQSSTGILVKKYERSLGSEALPANTLTTAPVNGLTPPPVGKTLDTEYQTGREVKQTQIVPGTIQRLHVGVVTQQPLSDEARERLWQVIAMAVGLDLNRGDDIAFTSAHSGEPTGVQGSHALAASSASPAQPQLDLATLPWLLVAVLAVLLLLALFAWLIQTRQRQQRVLDQAERERLLQQVRHWLATEEASK